MQLAYLLLIVLTKLCFVMDRYHGQLWVPLAGTYTFKLYATAKAALFVGSDNILNSTG